MEIFFLIAAAGVLLLLLSCYVCFRLLPECLSEKEN